MQLLSIRKQMGGVLYLKNALHVHGEDIRKLTEKVAILAKLAKLTHCR